MRRRIVLSGGLDRWARQVTKGSSPRGSLPAAGRDTMLDSTPASPFPPLATRSTSSLFNLSFNLHLTIPSHPFSLPLPFIRDRVHPPSFNSPFLPIFLLPLPFILSLLHPSPNYSFPSFFFHPRQTAPSTFTEPLLPVPSSPFLFLS